MPPAVTLVGLGNCGTALACAMHQAGIPMAELVVLRAPTAQQKKLAQQCKARLVRFAEWTSSDAHTVWLCVPDDALLATATELAERITRHDPGLTFLHTSGAHSYRILAPLQRRGVAIGAAHPFRSFPQRRCVSLHGTYFGIEGTPAARQAATTLVQRLGGVPFPLRTKDKARYHAFGAFASPLVVALLAASRQLGEHAGIPRPIVPKLLASLATGTFTNWQNNGAPASFSGPIARGDIETIRLHLASVAGMPELDAIYRSLSRFAVEHLPARHRTQLRLLLADPGLPQSGLPQSGVVKSGVVPTCVTLTGAR